MKSARVFLGLGANLGNPLNALRKALRVIDETAGISLCSFSPFYESAAALPPGAPKDWDIQFLNCVAECQVSLPPVELLAALKKIERDFGRKDHAHWAPREIDLDILCYATEIITTPELSIPHPRLAERPFVVLPFYDLAPDYVLPDGTQLADLARPWTTAPLASVPFETRKSSRLYTQFMGIVNLTPDSFSDGGKLKCAADAVQLAGDHLRNGAELIDIGAESTRPGAAAVSPELEWQRLADPLRAIRAEYPAALISVDTRHPATAERALTLGVQIINDVSGGSLEMLDIVAASGCDLILMHSKSIPADPKIVINEPDPVSVILRWAEEKLSDCERRGLDRSRITIDPGIGFGKTAEQSLQILREINRFANLKVPLLVGHSRKSFMRAWTNSDNEARDLETSSVSAYLVSNGVELLRVHTPGQNLKMSQSKLRLAGRIQKRGQLVS